MEEFVCQKNIEHYRKLLETRTAETGRREIVRLLAAEQDRLRHLALQRDAPTPTQ